MLRALKNFPALALLVPALVAAGCGGDGDGGGKLSADDQLRVIHDRDAINEFCIVSKAPKDSDIYVRDLYAAIDAVADLGSIAKKSPNKMLVVKVTKTNKPMRAILAEELNRLTKKCGDDGKKLGERLRRSTAGVS